MKNEVRETLKQPRAVSHFPSLSNMDDINPTIHTFMEDVYIEVMPLSGRFRQRDHFVELRGNPEDKSRAIAILQSLIRSGAYGSSDLRNLLSDSVRNIAINLAWHGRVVYEII